MLIASGNNRLNTLFDKFAHWLSDRNLFTPKNQNVDELVLNLIRIVIGLLLLYRLWNIGIFLFPLSPNAEEIIYFSLMIGLSFAILIGFITPIASLVLLLLQLRLNSPLFTYTLGVDVTAMMLVAFILYPAGRTLSIDAFLAKRYQAIKKLYSLFIYSNRKTQIALAKFIPFLSYSLLCLYSALKHINDSSWLNGEAAIEILSGTYLSKYPDFFQELFSTNIASIYMAKFSMIGMVVWYLALLPLVLFGGIGRKVTLVWMFLFFLVSAFILQLSILPYIELLLLVLWFWNGLFESNNTKNNMQNINVLYDDKCNLCDKTIRFLRNIDLYKIINFLPISSNLEKAELVNVKPEELYQDIYSWDEGSTNVYVGYEFYLHVTKNLTFLKLLYPLMWFFKYIKIGPAIYSFIAQRRIKLFGVCKIPVNLDHAPNTNLQDTLSAKSVSIFKSFILSFLLFTAIFILVLPTSPLHGSIDRRILISAHIISLSPIDVFNSEDRGMSYHFYTVTQLGHNNKKIIPFVDTNGSRLKWHKSDRVYFGNSLKWRRLKNNQPLLPPTDRDIKYFCEVVAWSEYYSHIPNATYQLDFYTIERPIQVDRYYKFPSPVKVSSIDISLKDCKDEVA